jgi:soluble lytic murein transglycosylase-like protein
MRIRGEFIRVLLASAARRGRQAVWAGAVGVALLGGPFAFAAAKDNAAVSRLVDVEAKWASELPQVLSAEDAARYKHIFALQSDKNWAAAERELAHVKNRLLVGDVLAQRYLNTYASYGELAAWLKDYSDHPEATAIYRLALKRMPKKHHVALRRPSFETLHSGWFVEDEDADATTPDQQPEAGAEIADTPSPPGPKLIGEMLGRARGIKGQIQHQLRIGDLSVAERMLRTREAARLLSDGEYDYLKARIAAGWFAQGDDAHALELASEAASRSGLVVPRANWIAGLSLYKEGKFLDAARYFVALARTPNARSWDLAAGAFWAARAYLQARRPEVFNYWALQAAQYPQTFYGMLAARTMSVQPAIDWDPPALSQSDMDSILGTSAGTRGFALIQAGQQAEAAREFERLEPTGGPGLLRALLGVAMRANMPSLSIGLGRQLAEIDGRRHDAALYPIPAWKPAGGFDIDPALVYAFMRQESSFNPRAVSPAGARGLMQVMPLTARLLDGRDFRGRVDQLYDPSFNMALGQKYLRMLLDNDVVNGDLIRLAAAYNGGPGNLAKWKRKQDARGDPSDDALLFIETVPSPETRAYITRVLYNYWIYSHRLGLPATSLEALAEGKWPTYAPNGAAPASPDQAPTAVASAPAQSPNAQPAADSGADTQPPEAMVVTPVLPDRLDDLPAMASSPSLVPAADTALPLDTQTADDEPGTTTLAMATAPDAALLMLPMPPPARPISFTHVGPHPVKARKKVRQHHVAHR